MPPDGIDKGYYHRTQLKGMRLQGTTELSINSETLEGNIPQVRAQLDQINFDNGITVLALQPEVGKTEAFIKYCEANPEKNIGYFAPNHNLLNEVELKLNKISSNVIHWRGKTNICQLYKKEDPYLKALIDSGLTTHFYCEFCEFSEKCQHKSYIDQFSYSEPSIILAPLEYIKKHVEEFDIIFVDEFVIKSYAYSLPEKVDVREAIRILRGFEKLPIFDDLCNELKIIKYTNETIVIGQISRIELAEKLNKIDLAELRRIFQKGMNESIPDSGKFGLLAKVLRDINNLTDYLKWKNIYKNSDGYEKDLKTYYEPYIYKLFELADSIPIVLMDATFNEELFEDLLRGYDGEFGINNFDINVYKTCIKNKDSVVYRVNPTAWYPKASLDGKIEDVKKLYNFHTQIGQKVGIITIKDVKEDYFDGFETLHYRNLRGKNQFENFDILILLGTPQPSVKGVIDTHNKLYLTNLAEYTEYYYELNEGKGIIKSRKTVDHAIQDIKDIYESVYLFTWDLDIKKNGWLIEWLKQFIDPMYGTINHDVGWLDNAIIEQNSDKKIKIFDKSHTILLRLYTSNNQVKLTREDGRIYNLEAKKDEDTYIISFKRKHPHLDKRRRLVRTFKMYGEDREPIKTDLIQLLLREHELYQAIYRIRPLSKPKTIYVWGIVPETVKDELYYKELTNLDKHINTIRMKYLRSIDLELYFIPEKRISEITDEIVRDYDCSPYSANKIINEYLVKSSKWIKDKMKIPTSKRPVDVVKLEFK